MSIEKKWWGADSLSPATPEMTEAHVAELEQSWMTGGDIYRDVLHDEVWSLVRSLVSGEKVLVDRAEIERALMRVHLNKGDNRSVAILVAILERSQSGAKQ